MKATVFHSNGHYETSEEHVVGGVEIIDGDLACNDSLDRLQHIVIKVTC